MTKPSKLPWAVETRENQCGYGPVTTWCVVDADGRVIFDALNAEDAEVYVESDVRLSLEELHRLKAASQESSPHLRLYFLLLVYTAGRKGAVTRLRLDRVNLDTRVLDLREEVTRLNVLDKSARLRRCSGRTNTRSRTSPACLGTAITKSPSAFMQYPKRKV